MKKSSGKSLINLSGIPPGFEGKHRQRKIIFQHFSDDIKVYLSTRNKKQKDHTESALDNYRIWEEEKKFGHKKNSLSFFEDEKKLFSGMND